MSEDLPFRCEYAKSGRAGCKKCKTPIEKESLRLAIMVRSPFFDGRTPNWFHYDCFFMKARPNGPEEIASYENLRFEDQKRIEKSIEEAKNGPAIAASNGKGKGSKKRKIEVVSGAVRDFTVEYAKSNRSGCKLCDNKIEKSQIRIGKLDYESEDAARFGPLNRWFHVECFTTARDELGYFWSASDLPNFDSLEKEDQKKLSKKITSKDVKAEKAPKIEIDPKVKKESAKEDKQLKKQSDLLFNYVDNLKNLRKRELMELYELNDIKKIPSDTNKRIEYIADALTFGLPQECPKCGDCLRFKISRYICMGNVSEWEACSYTTEEPKRRPLKIPKELLEYDFLKNYKYKARKRIFNTNLKNSLALRTNQELAALNIVKAEGDNTDGVVDTSKILSGYKVAILGKVPCKPKIEQFGGNLAKTIDRAVLFVVTDEETFKKTKSKQLKLAEEHSIPLVKIDIFDALAKNTGILQGLVQSNITLWNKEEDEIEKRIDNLNVKSKIKSTFKSGAKSVSSKQLTKSKVVYKSGAVVDPGSELEQDAHILKDGNSFYNAVLNQVDVTKNKNSYYKLQLLEDDRMNGKFWVFKSWGRIGTTIGGTKLENFRSKIDAVEHFKSIYYERTQNHWEDRKNFRKHPNAYYPIDVDYGEFDDSKLDVEISKSTLPEPVKNLISMIFDVTRMKQTMLEFELDLEKMPLGKLSKNQLLEACSTLKEISSVLDVKPLNVNKITAICNKFYSLVPHSFGTARPPLITDPAVISKKMEMLESLMDIELAYEIIKNVTSDEDPIDFHYKKLNTIIEPLERNDEEFKLVQKYMQNTHAKTHSSYTLELVDLFKVQRIGEDIRFKKFQDNPNRMLLWHGSRMTNYVGILSQGLRIAPPEAPVCGYMFGKGVYFADSVSKSANYCNVHTSADNGLMLLSEVAIGKSLEFTQSNYVTKLDKEYHSVKGVGGSHPDPKKIHVLPDGLKVPLGKMVKNKDNNQTSLLYNEYIVYNEEQIKIRYLLNVKFNFNQLF